MYSSKNTRIPQMRTLLTKSRPRK